MGDFVKSYYEGGYRLVDAAGVPFRTARHTTDAVAEMLCECTPFRRYGSARPYRGAKVRHENMLLNF